ncbi:MAG: ribokinase [Clostridiaceae bacterium]
MVKIAVIGICGKSVFMRVDHFHHMGETLIADSIFEEMGGKGFNQAIAAARMGAGVSLLAAVGGDMTGEKCGEILAENNVKACLAMKKGKSSAIAYILTDRSGENQVTEYQSAELCEEDVAQFEEEIAGSDILLIQQEVPKGVNRMAVEIANSYRVKVILNPAPPRAVDDFLAASVFMVTPNRQEATAIDCKRFKNYIITLGSDGCCVNGNIKIPPIDVRPIDTTGAGDTFNGVLAVCIAEGMALEEAARYAVTASGISVSKKNVINAIPYRNEIERRMKNE